MIKRLLVMFILTVIAMGCVIYSVDRTHRQTALIDWDGAYIDGRHLLFTIEEENDTVYSKVLAKYLRTGRLIRVYEVMTADRPIDDVAMQIGDGIASGDIVQLYENDMAIAKPWSIAVGQADDDPHVEIFIAAYKATRYFPAEVRPYFLEYRDGVIIRNWTGSYLDCDGFNRAEFTDVDGDGIDELRLIEYHYNGHRRQLTLAYYRLMGFVPRRYDMNGGDL